MTCGNNMDKMGNKNNKPCGPYNENLLTRGIMVDYE
jgi:hypothetical protein